MKSGRLPTVAAVSLIERQDGRILCVWNGRYGGWALPGGKVEEGESAEQAQARELLEETGLETLSAQLFYEGPHGITVDSTRGSTVRIYYVVAHGAPREVELGRPVTWLTRDEFLRWSPFARFYQTVFAAYPPRATPIVGDRREARIVSYPAVLEVDTRRGVIYVHSTEYGNTMLRICSLPTPVPDPNPAGNTLLDITFGYGVSWKVSSDA